MNPSDFKLVEKWRKVLEAGNPNTLQDIRITTAQMLENTQHIMMRARTTVMIPKHTFWITSKMLYTYPGCTSINEFSRRYSE
jgi:hypothetical protein